MNAHAGLFGRYQTVEPPHNLGLFHQHDPETTGLKEVDHEPLIGVLDQEDLVAQGIDTSELIKGAPKVDALGSCTAQTATEALSNELAEDEFVGVPVKLDADLADLQGYGDVVQAERAAIVFYHLCTDQTGDPSQEWPPTDCGSSGPYVTELLIRLGLIKTQKIAHGADNVVSMMQRNGSMVGSPFLQAWMNPTNSEAMIDNDGSAATLRKQIAQGVAGGHEFYMSAIEELVLYPHGDVNPWKTICRFRNHWTDGWGDKGNFRAHLSTFTHVLGAYTDIRQIVA